MGFGTEMGEQVNTLSDEMELFGLPLIIEKLKFEHPLKEEFVGKLELSARDSVLVDDADTNNQLTVVSIVWLWENPIE